MEVRSTGGKKGGEGKRGQERNGEQMEERHTTHKMKYVRKLHMEGYYFVAN